MGEDMHRLSVLGGALLVAVALGVSYASAGPELVLYPDGYATGFVRYTTVDRPDRKPPIVRFMYVNPDALLAAKPGAALPDRTVIVMEDHKAALNAAGEPVLDANGRFVPTDEITNVFVQEKRAGWGADYPAEVRNGEWEYARFEPDGARKTGEKVKYDGCFECHKGVAEQDFNFTLSPFISQMKGG